MQHAPPAATHGSMQVVWRLMKARSEEDIQQQLAQWFAQWKGEEPATAELASWDIAGHIARRDWDAIKTRLERRFGRYHPRHKPLIDALMAASQAQRMLNARSRQKMMDELCSAESRGRTL